HGLLGRPPAGQALVVAGAVSELGGRVDLPQEAGAGTFDGKRDAVDRDGIDADALHGINSAGSPHPARSTPILCTASILPVAPTRPGSLREPGRPPPVV